MTRRRPRLIALVTAALRVATVATHASPPTQSAVDRAAATRAAHLPKHLGLGVKAFPNSYGTRGWMQDSGVPWDYAYQYLGGLGSGSNWTTWLPRGRYVIDYAGAAAKVHAIPVFSYFQINHAAGGCGTCTTMHRNLRNLASPPTMRRWWADYRTLLQRLSAGTYDGVKGYGGTSVIHVEPDLSAMAQQALIHPSSCPRTCTPGARGPDGVAAAVSATGDPDLVGFANTYAGFNAAVLALRDRYAPNVLLGYHVSNWAGRYDVGVNTQPLDVRALADQVAAFAIANGASHRPGKPHYDLIVNDILDRDSGAYDVQFHKHDSWWDADNVRLPHFARWQSYLGRIVTKLHLPVVVWQVPVGNQDYLTSDNSYGHTQDNKVAYLTAHLRQLRDLGVLAVLFGSGNPGSTVQWDGQQDGVTNYPGGPLCSRAGRSSGTRCWARPSTVTDDDGGFLRERGAAYYRAGPLPRKAP
jgi:hypothetical protein